VVVEVVVVVVVEPSANVIKRSERNGIVKILGGRLRLDIIEK